jgi:hypothetical protein
LEKRKKKEFQGKMSWLGKRKRDGKPKTNKISLRREKRENNA